MFDDAIFDEVIFDTGATLVVTPGGSGMHRRYWDERELQRLREEEELIILMAGELWLN